MNCAFAFFYSNMPFFLEWFWQREGGGGTHFS
jgi:hypothetical protein